MTALRSDIPKPLPYEGTQTYHGNAKRRKEDKYGFGAMSDLERHRRAAAWKSKHPVERIVSCATAWPRHYIRTMKLKYFLNGCSPHRTVSADAAGGGSGQSRPALAVHNSFPATAA